MLGTPLFWMKQNAAISCDMMALSVGARGFEPPTSCSQSKRANRAALRPDVPLFLLCLTLSYKVGKRPTFSPRFDVASRLFVLCPALLRLVLSGCAEDWRLFERGKPEHRNIAASPGNSLTDCG